MLLRLELMVSVPVHEQTTDGEVEVQLHCSATERESIDMWLQNCSLGVVSHADYSESVLWGTFYRIVSRVYANERMPYVSFRLSRKV